MKKITCYATAIIFSAFIFSSQGCAKKKSDTQNNTDCKACKAFATDTKPEATQEVCNDSEEQTFRSQHSGQEISCH